MEDVVIVSGVRTPIGKFQGAYSNLPASDLGAIVIRAAVERAGLKKDFVFLPFSISWVSLSFRKQVL